MDGPTIQQKIYYGYAKAASKLGATYNLYRATTPLNPIASGNLIGSILASTNVSWTYMRANKYPNALWQILIDAQRSSAPLNAQVFDYIVGVNNTYDYVSDNNTYFILSEQFLQPIQAVKCNNTLNIIRPSQPTGPGNVGYVGYLQETSETIMTNMPASVLEFRRGESSDLKLPTDSSEPLWKILLPYIGNVAIEIGDIIIDQTDENYVVMSNELTELGWQLQAKQVVNSR